MSNLGHDVAVAFANAVTVSSCHEYDWVARNGTYNIFNMFHHVCPTVWYEQPNCCLNRVLTVLLCRHFGGAAGSEFFAEKNESNKNHLPDVQERKHQLFEDFQPDTGRPRLL
jgi:hypothetical protein